MTFMGIDLHTNQLTAAIFDQSDTKPRETIKMFYLDKQSLKKFFALLTKDTYVVIESTCNAFWFHDQIADKVKVCYVYDTNAAYRNGNKTDKKDAKHLLRLLMYHVLTNQDKTSFPTIFVPPQDIRELRKLFSLYFLHKKTTTQFKNFIHSILKQNGISSEKKAIDRKDFIFKVEKLELTKCQVDMIKNQYGSVLMLKGQVAEIEEMILLKGYELFTKEINLLITIRGISAFTAIAIMTEIVDVARFPNAKEFCSYLRTAPKITASNNKQHIGSVNKASRATVCSLLTQSVLHLQNAGEHIQAFYNRVKKGKSIGKVRIAVIRKILVCIYNMLKKGEEYYWKEDAFVQKKSQYLEMRITGIKEKFEKKELKLVS